MPVRFLSDAELARLSGWPDDVADDDLVTFFTLTSDDLGWLGSNIRIENRLGVGRAALHAALAGLDTGRSKRLSFGRGRPSRQPAGARGR